MIIIKKYSNRKLYNTEKSSYITIEDIILMVQNGVEFKVVDKESGKDITTKIIAQAFIKMEKKEGKHLKTLRKIVSTSGDSLSEYFYKTKTAIKGEIDKVVKKSEEEIGDIFQQIQSLYGVSTNSIEYLSKRLDEKIKEGIKSFYSKELIDENKNLKKRVNDMEREIEFLKKEVEKLKKGEK